MKLRTQMLTAISAKPRGRSYKDLCQIFIDIELERLNDALTLLVCEGVIAATAECYVLTDAGRSAMSAADWGKP